jgi:hypothetical protein
MTRRLLGLAVLLIALAGAIYAGTLVRAHLEGPDPVETVRTATMAYADGDCSRLREVSARPEEIDCSAVRQVQQAYRDEGLRPTTFTYALANQSGDTATVRVSYVKDGDPLEEMIPVVKDHGDWKISAVGGHVD